MLLSMSKENGLRRMNRECGWSLGLFFDYHGGDDPQPMLSLVSPNELNKSGRDILSHVSAYPVSPSLLLFNF